MNPLPWHHRWNVLALLMISQGLSIGIHSFCFPFWVVPWIEEFNAPRSELMLIITSSAIAFGVISPFAGYALDRLPTRVLFCVGTLIFSGSLFLVSLATSHWMILVVYGTMLPIGVALNGNLAGQTLITRWFSTNRGFAIGLGAFGISIGAFVMPLLVTTLLASHGWRATFQILAFASLVLILPFAWLVLRQSPEPRPTSATEDTPERTAPAWTTATLLRNRNFWIIAGGFAAIQTALIPTRYNLGAYALDLGISQSQAAMIASMLAVSNAIGKLTYGKLVDTLAPRHTYWIAATISAIAVGIVAGANRFSTLAVGMMLVGFSMGCLLPVLSSLVADRFGTQAFGQVVGLAWTVINISAISPFLAGLVRDVSGAYPLAFLCLLLPLLPAALAMRRLGSKLSQAGMAS